MPLNRHSCCKKWNKRKNKISILKINLDKINQLWDQIMNCSLEYNSAKKTMNEQDILYSCFSFYKIMRERNSIKVLKLNYNFFNQCRRIHCFRFGDDIVVVTDSEKVFNCTVVLS